MALAELFLALQLLDGVKQRDGIAPSSTPRGAPQTDQERFIEGTKDFIEGIKDKLKWPPSKRK